jgi:Ca2+-binding RTX toxin-like protein
MVNPGGMTMPTLTVAATTDYRTAPNNALVNGQNITAITFTSAGFADASFAPTQFGGANISNNVAITGSGGTNSMTVLLPAAGSFSAAGWTFSNWLSNDQVNFFGSINNDSITGSSVADRFFISDGLDTLRGGDGDDVFESNIIGSASANSIFDGGAGIDTVSFAAGSLTINYANLQLISIERLTLAQNFCGAIMSASQANNLTQIQGETGTIQSVAINGTGIDLSDIVFSNWTNGTDTITITGNGLGVSLTGSSQNDTITATGGSIAATNVLRGGGGADTLTGENLAGDINIFAYGVASDVVAGEIITGRSLSTDKIQLDGIGFYDFRNTTLASTEAVNFNGTGVKTAVFNSSQFGAGLSNSLQFDGTSAASVNTLEIRMDTLSFSAAAFTNVNFTIGSDILSIIGTANGDNITAASFGSRMTGGAGQDFVVGGVGNDTFVFTAQSEVVGGESILGGGGTDTLAITTNAAFDFSGLGGGGIKRLLFETTGPASITVNSGSAGLDYALLAIEAISTQAMTFTVNQIGLLFSAAAWTLDAEFTTGGTIVLNGAFGPVGNKSITGSAGRDSITGGNGNDTLIGGGGDDTLIGGFGTDSISGGAGNDIIKLFQGQSSDNVDGGTETDLLDLSGLTTNTANVNLTTNLWSTAGDFNRSIISIEQVTGGGGNDSITGGSIAETLSGGGGNDTLIGNGGVDSLSGGDGDDVFGHNSSTIVVSDTIGGGSGTDTIDVASTANTSFALASISSVEKLTFSNTTGICGAFFVSSQIGNSALGRIDQITGSTGVNRLFVEGVSTDLAALVFTNWSTNDSVELQDTFGSDSLVGSSQNDIFYVGVGTDTLNGGGGTDVVNYFATGAIAASLTTGGTVGDAAGDVYISIEHLSGGLGNDTLSGDGGANSIAGNDGADILDGGGGDDTLTGNIGADSLNGSGDNDILNGGAGADSLTGGTGWDTASYTNSSTTVQVVMYDTQYNTGEAAGDVFNGMEALQGSNFIDILVGDFAVNAILGGGGDDWIDGTEGGDFLFGETGNDNLVSHSLADFLDGGEGFDLARYDFADAGLRAYLYDATQNSGFAAGDTLTSIEGIAGSHLSDDLRGDASGNVLFGLTGNDFLIGLGGADILAGGTGFDLFHFVGIGDGGASGDIIQDFVSGTDRISVTGAFFGLGSPGGITIDSFRFVSGAAANLATSQFIYNGATQQLFYDQDGTGAGVQALLATLQAGAAMAAGDILVL